MVFGEYKVLFVASARETEEKHRSNILGVMEGKVVLVGTRGAQGLSCGMIMDVRVIRYVVEYCCMHYAKKVDGSFWVAVAERLMAEKDKNDEERLRGKGISIMSSSISDDF